MRRITSSYLLIFLIDIKYLISSILVKSRKLLGKIYPDKTIIKLIKLKYFFLFNYRPFGLIFKKYLLLNAFFIQNSGFQVSFQIR